MTEEFKKWFEGSTVVDEHGNPLKVYHGSPRKFKNFNFHTSSMIFFATNRKVAEYFADGNEVKECYLNIKRPFEFDAKCCLWDNLPQDLEDEEWYDGLCIEDLIGEHALGKGFDGAYIKDIIETDSHDWGMKYLTDDYVVFDPSQIWIIGEDMEEKRFTENKDSRIDKLNMTDEQKAQVKELFHTHPELESKIDWNRRDLTYDDFKGLFDVKSKSSKKKASKKGGGLSALTEGEDYSVVQTNGRFTLYEVNTYEAMCIIASNAVAPSLRARIPDWAKRPENEWYQNKTRDAVTGTPRADGAHWCVAMTKTKAHWDEYDNKLFYVCTDAIARQDDPFGKVCLFADFASDEEVGLDEMQFWNADDSLIGNEEFEENAPDMYGFLSEITFRSKEILDTPIADMIREVFHHSPSTTSYYTLKESDNALMYYDYRIDESWDEDLIEELYIHLEVNNDIFSEYRDTIHNIYGKYIMLLGKDEDMVEVGNDGSLCYEFLDDEDLEKVYNTLVICFNEISDLKPTPREVAPTVIKENMERFLKMDNVTFEEGEHLWKESDRAMLSYNYWTERTNRGMVEKVKITLTPFDTIGEEGLRNLDNRFKSQCNTLGGVSKKRVNYHKEGGNYVLEMTGDVEGDVWYMLININKLYRDIETEI